MGVGTTVDVPVGGGGICVGEGVAVRVGGRGVAVGEGIGVSVGVGLGVSIGVGTGVGVNGTPQAMRAIEKASAMARSSAVRCAFPRLAL